MVVKLKNKAVFLLTKRLTFWEGFFLPNCSSIFPFVILCLLYGNVQPNRSQNIYREKIKPSIIFIISILFPLPCPFSVLVNMNPPSPLLPGEPLSLVCNAETPPSKKKPQIHWLNPQKKKMENNQRQVTVRATSQHHGEWTCVVTNNGKEYEARIFVTVVGELPCSHMYAFVVQ